MSVPALSTSVCEPYAVESPSPGKSGSPSGASVLPQSAPSTLVVWLGGFSTVSPVLLGGASTLVVWLGGFSTVSPVLLAFETVLLAFATDSPPPCTTSCTRPPGPKCGGKSWFTLFDATLGEELLESSYGPQ